MNNNYIIKYILNLLQQNKNSLDAIIVICGILLILLILGNLAIIRLSRNSGEKYRYLSWLYPFNIYYLIKVSLGNPYAFITFIATALASNISITILGKTISTKGILPNNICNILLIICYLITIISIIKLYKNYSKNWILYTILTLLTLGLLSPIFLFVIRNNQREQLENINEEINTSSNIYVTVNKQMEKLGKEANNNVDRKIEDQYEIDDVWEGPK